MDGEDEFFDPFEASLPYNDPVTGHTSGHAGSETSAERARKADLSGDTALRQRAIRRALAQAGSAGLNANEVIAAIGWDSVDSGPVTGALSNLHKDGKIARLHEVRQGKKVYVLPVYTEDRDTEPHGKNTSKVRLDTLRAYLAAMSESHSFVEIEEVQRIIQ